MRKSCFECEQPATVNHHVIPASLGGKKTVPLCAECHSKVHDAKLFSSSELSRKGKERIQALHVIEKVLELYESGQSKNSIALSLGIRRQAVYRILERAGLHENKSAGNVVKFTEASIRSIIKMRQQRKSWKVIEEKLGISHTHLFRMIKKLNLYDGHYNNPMRESYCTLTDEVIESAKKLRRDHALAWKDIATRLGINLATLYRHGLPKQFPHLRNTVTEAKEELILRLRGQGKTWKEVCAISGISMTEIYRKKLHQK